MDQPVIPDLAAPVSPMTVAKKPREEKDEYFAKLPDDKIGDALWARKQEYEKFLKQSGLYAVYRKMHWRYYGQEEKSGFTTHEVGTDGAQGELHVLKLNHLRSIVASWLGMVHEQRPAVTPVAINDDYESELEVKRGKALLDHHRGPSGAAIEAREQEVEEMAGLYGHSGLLQLWNDALGDVLMPQGADAGLPMANPADDLEGAIRAGDLEAFSISPLNMFFDPRRHDAKMPWKILRIFKPREDIIARWPKFEEQILGMKNQREADGADGIDFNFMFMKADSTTPLNARDELPLYVFLHDKTESMPDGKQVIFLDAKTVLKSGPLGYKRSTFKRLAAATIDGTPFGFSPAWDLLAPQEAHDSLSTIALTNARTFGLGVLTGPKGADIEPEQITEGLILLPYTQGLDKPSPIQMPTTPQEVFGLRNSMAGEMGTLLGVNSVIRGDPEASLKSGSALALVQAQGIQFSRDFQGNVVRFIEDHSLDTIETCQLFMENERQFEIIGSHVASLTLPFSGDKLKRITKVRVQIVNPMSKTIAGRVQMADTLAERFPGQISPGDYFRVLDTGNGDHLTKGLEQKTANIDRENELLAQGFGPIPVVPSPELGPDEMGQIQMAPKKEEGQRYVVALITDDHRAHVKKHLDIVDNPAIRDSTSPLAIKIIKATLDHIDEHARLLGVLTTQRLDLLELTGQQPLQAALPPPIPGGPPPPGGHPPPPPKAEGPPGPQNRAPPGQTLQPTPAGAGHLPNLPSMPVNPSTGNRNESPGPH